jgi:hypothetical protein
MSTVTVLLHGKNVNGASHKKQVPSKEVSEYIYKLLIYLYKNFLSGPKKGAFIPVWQKSAP